MNVFRLGKDKIKKNPESSVTIGTFDGVHRGHHSILNKVLEDGNSTVVTFDPHPQHVMTNKPGIVKIITPLQEKLRKLELLKIERVVIIPFTVEFASISAEDFLKNILIDTIGLKNLVIGFNHAFGKGRQGNAEFLQDKALENNYRLFVVKPYTVDGITISSTLIRKTIEEGNIAEANHYLGKPFRLIGITVKGDGRGRKLGFPTANLRSIENFQIIPREGVYSARVRVGEVFYDGVVSVGTCSTFDKNKLVVEAHIFDFEMDLYNQEIAVDLYEFLRGQEKFDSAESLKKQMSLDCDNARKSLAKYPKRKQKN